MRRAVPSFRGGGTHLRRDDLAERQVRADGGDGEHVRALPGATCGGAREVQPAANEDDSTEQARGEEAGATKDHN